MIVVTATTDTRAAWAKKITDQWRDSVNAIINVGVTLREAKGALSAADFAEMITNDLPFGERAARMFVAIGQSERLRKHASALPASWYSLYELQRLPEKIFEKAVEDGRIHPDMERKEVAALAELSRPTPPKPQSRPEPREAEWTETPAPQPPPLAPMGAPQDSTARRAQQIDTALDALDTLIMALSLLDPKAVAASEAQSKRDKLKRHIGTARALFSTFERALGG